MSLISDYRNAGGVCENSLMSEEIDLSHIGAGLNIDYSGHWQVSTTACETDDGTTYSYSNVLNVARITRGLCSAKTEELLRIGEVCNAYSLYKEKEDHTEVRMS